MQNNKNKNYIKTNAQVQVTFDKNKDDFIFRITIPTLNIHGKRIEGMENYFDYITFFNDQFEDKDYSLQIKYAPTNFKNNEDAFIAFNGVLEAHNEMSIYA